MNDRRAARRYDLSLPTLVRFSADNNVAARNGRTRDLSSDGVYFTTQDDLGFNAELSLMMILPTEVTGGTDVFIQACATVVRVDNFTCGGTGVAAAITRYDIIRNESAPPPINA